MNTKEMIGSRIKAIRKKKEFTQEKLSELVGINVKYLSGIERGKENPTLNIFLNIADLLDVNLDEIFDQLQIEDPSIGKSNLISLLDKADNEQLKLDYKIISILLK